MPSAAVLYHFFHPDDVVSARHMTEFAAGLAERGWQVSAHPCNRGCRDESAVYPARDVHAGVRIERIWRPPLRQSSTVGRVINALWMIVAWAEVLRRLDGTVDVAVIGTDPVLGLAAGRMARRRGASKIRLAAWCYDLYPDAVFADRVLSPDSVLGRFLTRTAAESYRSCDLVADIGSCMAGRIAATAPGVKSVTLVPWALDEPSAPLPRTAGDAAPLLLLYSGNFGRAHAYDDLLELAGRCDPALATTAFAVRGNRVAALRAAVAERRVPVKWMPFCDEARLKDQLAAGDIHLASLRGDWTGVVVPSKFFGSLAAGRPVIFAGSRESSLARWIHEYGVGWVLDRETVTGVVAEIASLALDRQRLLSLHRHCHEVYGRRFSRRLTMDRWDSELRRLIAR